MRNAAMRALFALLLLASCKAPAPPPARAATGGEVRDISVTSRGFEPARVSVPAGKPVTLRFTRKVAETCANEVDVQNDPVRHSLPLDIPVDVKVTAPASGELAFACPMKMYQGAVVVQ
jgi:plastocyanin domain-containing protein